MSFVCSSCRLASRLSQAARSKKFPQGFIPFSRHSSSFPTALDGNSRNNNDKYEKYTQDVSIPQRHPPPQTPSGNQPAESPPPRPPRPPRPSRPSRPPAQLSPEEELRRGYKRTKKIPGVNYDLEPSGDIRKTSRRERDTVEESQKDLENIYQMLLRNKGFDGTRAAWKAFEDLETRFGFSRLPDSAGYLDHDKMFKLLLKRVIEHYSTASELPNPRWVLDRWERLGVARDAHWAELIFGYIRNRDDEAATALWREYLEAVQSSGRRREPTPSFTTFADKKVDKASFRGDDIALCSIAAITAYFRTDANNLKVPNLGDLFHRLKAGVKGEHWKINLPSTKDIMSILSSYDLPSQLIKSTIDELLRLRPYTDLSDHNRVALMDQISYAAFNRDHDRLDKLYETHKKETEGKTVNMMVFSAFISAFVECGKMNKMTAVWNDMVSSGEVPGIRAWGALLDGAAKGGDVRTFEKTWNELEKTKMPIDNICWTIRTQFYYSIARRDLGWKCIQYMESINMPITSHTINAIISSLDAKELYHEAAELLRWALDKGISKDIVTYNLFIRAQMQEGNFRDAAITIKAMKRDGVEPDLFTYCSVVNGLFSKKNITPPSLSLIRALLLEMKELEIRPNLYFFNTLLNGMLTQYKDEVAAKEILSMMPDQAWRTSPVTSNILIQHYARHGDLDAVEVIWKNMVQYGASPDAAVFGSTIELFAKAGNAGQAKYYLGMMLAARKKPTIRTFTKVLRCLVNDGDYKFARRVIEDMVNLGVYTVGNKHLDEVVAELESSESLLRSRSNQSVW